ncbi:MAG: hypothetical protein BGO07_03260 [Alphaproteobacteria bacterium 40-19]|nr:MAG: hypothetical protein BGO07_03260 [Alphaproteobacteria bacterium 40-19]
MKTTCFGKDHHLKIAANYYNVMLAKDCDKMASYLHENIHFIGPLAEMHGKDPVVLAAKNFSQIV